MNADPIPPNTIAAPLSPSPTPLSASSAMDSNALHCPIHTVADVIPCPVEELAPLLSHLEANRPVEEAVPFPRGTVLPDGRLDLCKQSLGVRGCYLVVDALAKNTTVKSLLLGTDGIGDEGAARVAELLQNGTSLEIVYLGCNHIQSEGVASLAAALANNQSVQGLWLKRNPVGPEGTAALAEMLRTNQTLRVLDLVNTQLGEAGLTALIKVLTHENRTVERLYLGGNGIGPRTAHQLAQLLRVNPALKALLLNVNHLGDEGATILADGLKANATLTELGLASNDIGPEGGAELMTAVASHPSLKFLDLGYAVSTRVLGASANRLGDAGCEAVSAMLTQNKSLEVLFLFGNGIGESGKTILASGLERNTTLRLLLLDGKADARLTALIERNLTLGKAAGRPRHKSPRDVEMIRSVYRTAPANPDRPRSQPP